jgi:hypothetical protein
MTESATTTNGVSDTTGLADAVEELLAQARRAHESIHVDSTLALRRALEAGEALLEAKARVRRGEWTERLGGHRHPGQARA